jgi:DNA-binding transcriptional LysR family regulator
MIVVLNGSNLTLNCMDMNKKAPKSIELRHLLYFTTVIKAGSFSKAARQLGMTQPPLSFQLQELEDALGVKLFVDRQQRPLELTKAGAEFFRAAQEIQAKLEKAIKNTKGIDSNKSSTLTVGFTPAIANSIMPDILRIFRQTYPDAKLILNEEDTPTQIQRLRDRTTDVMFLYQYSGMFESVTAAKDLKVKQIYRESLVVVLPEHHKLTEHSEISIKDLDGLDFIMPDRQYIASLFTEIQGLFLKANSTPQIVLQAVFMNTILGLVAGGIGVSILPDSIQNVQRKGVAYRPLSGHNTNANRLYLVWRKKNVPLILENFIKVVDDFTATVQLGE